MKWRFRIQYLRRLKKMNGEVRVSSFGDILFHGWFGSPHLQPCNARTLRILHPIKVIPRGIVTQWKIRSPTTEKRSVTSSTLVRPLGSGRHLLWSNGSVNFSGDMLAFLLSHSTHKWKEVAKIKLDRSMEGFDIQQNPRGIKCWFEYMFGDLERLIWWRSVILVYNM